MRANLSLRGLMAASDIDFMAGLKTLPGVTSNPVKSCDISYDTLVNYIVYEADELEVRCPNPLSMQAMVNVWCAANMGIFTEMYDTFGLEYNPIHNYDRTETHTLTETRNLQKTRTGTNKNEGTLTDSSNGSDTRSGSENRTITDDGTTTTDTKKAGFNSETPVISENVTTNNDNTNTSQVTDSQNITTESSSNSSSLDTTTYNTTDGDTGTIKHDETITARGNIGVTTTQQMLTDQRKLVEFGWCQYITGKFIDFFCLKVY